MRDVFDAALDGEFPVVDDKLVHWAETKLGRKLPASLVDHLRGQNGGDLRRSVFPTSVKNYSADGFVPVEYIAGISRDQEDADSLLCAEYMTREWGLPPGLVLPCGDGHSWIALDYRKNAPEPEVSFIDFEREQEVVLAPTFSDFVQGLTSEESAG
jgi:hypothetical protein